jgi:signal recognition particle subunit SRP19
MASSAAAPRQHDKRRFQTIYPQYIDANIPPSSGRRISLSHAVANPSLEEMMSALLSLGFKQCFVDPMKSLPSMQSKARLVPAPRGCVKVAIKAPQDEHYVKKSEFDQQTRAAVVDELPNRSTVMRRMAALIKERNPARPPVPNIEAIVAQAMAPQVTTKSSGPASSKKK